ncbi:MAG: TraY domain-containing protein [Rhodospirillaceae bacterium]|jgi:hypothetical protein|nr:TraY domain-containing protein [Rhodospirillaceae bacterium]MBT5083771.1 TraY domain-containing protein [Rhodospirillaceae bacterium]MBT5522994.1 TraY domain-containing protein [Rhodospirillaceae bacterium]MBT5879731.1 TraY domain-containing protein [Rhodospirillaceae bacterium]MBT7978276.1 TraY domain-containing protein [Rhodospirillaceae bacterium]
MAMTKDRKRGRPRKPDGEAKRSAIGVRVTAEAKQKLQEAADRTGRSLSQEIELRLQQSLDFDDQRQRDFGDESTLRLMRAMATAKLMAEMTWGTSAFEDPATSKVARDAMVAVLDGLLLPLAALEPKDQIEPEAGQAMLLNDPNSRLPADNIRDCILLGLGPTIPAARATLDNQTAKPEKT